LWRTGSARRSSCTLAGALGKRFVPTLYTDCQQSHHNVSIGVVLLVVGLVGVVVTFVPARAGFRWWRAHAATMPAPAGWMRVPVGWRPVNGPFMPVPPGWPQPVADWVAPSGWVPPATWPEPPKGWPRPESRSPAELRRAMAAARVVYVIGFAVFGVEVADPLPVNAVGALLLLWPLLVAVMCLINLVVSFRGLRMFPPYQVALFVGFWALLYADVGKVGHAELSAFVLAVIEFALAAVLGRQRPSKATRLPNNLWRQPAPPPPGEQIAEASGG